MKYFSTPSESSVRDSDARENLLTVITDNIVTSADTTWATVVSASDYYPFGLTMEGRNYQDSLYRYGFNGKEKDDQGEWGNTNYDYGFRIYDPRLGKFLSIDPVSKEYPALTPYQYANNNPISLVDMDGLQGLRPGSTTRRTRRRARSLGNPTISDSAAKAAESLRRAPTIPRGLFSGPGGRSGDVFEIYTYSLASSESLNPINPRDLKPSIRQPNHIEIRRPPEVLDDRITPQSKDLASAMAQLLSNIQKNLKEFKVRKAFFEGSGTDNFGKSFVQRFEAGYDILITDQNILGQLQRAEELYQDELRERVKSRFTEEEFNDPSNFNEINKAYLAERLFGIGPSPTEKVIEKLKTRERKEVDLKVVRPTIIRSAN